MEKTIKTLKNMLLFGSIIAMLLFVIVGCSNSNKSGIIQNSEVINNDATVNNAVETSNNLVTVNTGSNVLTKTTNSYTIAQVKMHDTIDDCWVYSDGVVYDITDLLASNKDQLKQFCGSDDFENAYHSNALKLYGNSIANYEIGVLIE